MAKRSSGKTGKSRASGATTGKWVAPRTGGYSALSHSGRTTKRSSSMTRQVKPPKGRAGASAATGVKK